MKRNSLLICLFAVLFLSSCGGRSKTASALANGDTIPLRYAENLTLMSYPGYTLATLRNPWDTLHTLHTYILVPKDRELPAHLPAGTVVRTPLSKSVIYSCRRGAIADCGDGMNPDMERIIDLHPDAILLSPFENSGGYGRIEKLDIPIIECADYMETSALGRAEWMRFYGLLFGVAPQADSLFAEVDSCYQRLKMRAQLSSTSFSVVSELKSGSAWYVPGGRSTIGRLFQDACGRYAFADDTHSGSVPLAFETVFDKAGDADVWLVKYNRDRDMTYADLEADYIGYTGFKAFKTRNVYGCNTAKVPFYEETPFRPDYLLSDLIQILHPEIGDLGGLRYFCRLKE